MSARIGPAPVVWRTLRRLLLALALTVSLGPAQAGRSCEPRAPEVANVLRSLALAERTAAALDATGAGVVVLARAGQDLSRWGLRWSHLGFAYRGEEGWRVVHKLNHCGSAEAQLYRQGLAEFFLDDPHEYRTAWAVLEPALQQRLRLLLPDNARVAQLHTPAYSMVAYPWAQSYQQSNQWALETLALALDPAASDRERAQAWLRLHGYAPSVLRVGALARLAARVGSANVAFDDHPGEKRFADRIETVSVDSVFDWLRRSGHAVAWQELQ